MAGQKLIMGSLNARGLGDRVKRRLLFYVLRTKYKYNVVLIQEAHIKDVQQLNIWRQEWGGHMYASYGESNARGVLVLIHPKCDIDVKNINCDDVGRILCMQITVNDVTYSLCNIYAPNSDDPNFFSEVIKMVNRDCYVKSQSVIMGGDFNFVMDPKIDRLQTASTRTQNHRNAHQVVKEFMMKENLSDI